LAIFTGCFVPSGLVMRLFVLHPSTNASRWWRLAANFTMALASWIFVVGLPVAIVAEEVAHTLILDRIPTGSADPYSWLSALLFSALVSAAVELLVLRIFFKQKLLRPALGLVFAIDLCCVGAAAYATAKYVLAHPPNRLPPQSYLRTRPVSGGSVRFACSDLACTSKDI
jgi:hypothetical protein